MLNDDISLTTKCNKVKKKKELYKNWKEKNKIHYLQI